MENHRPAGRPDVRLPLGRAVPSLAARAPVDETRYLAVAWEMWHRGVFVLPYLNGAPYDHKPPLLFWLIHAGWAVVGVNKWWSRLISPLCSIGSLLGLQQLAARLWPQNLQAGRLGTLMLLSSWYVAVYQTGVMSDMLAEFISNSFRWTNVQTRCHTTLAESRP